MRRVIFNQKGGVGKSTITCNLAAISAVEGKKTLVIDLFGNSKDAGLGSIVQETPFPNLFVIASHPELESLQGRLESRYKIFKLREALDKLEGFDRIYIDTPPVLNFYSQSALIAAERCLIPFDCDTFAREALYTLLRSITEVKADHNEKLLVEGIVVNQYQKQANLPRQLVDELIAEGLPVLETKISTSVKVRESHSDAQPLIYYAPNHKLTEEYIAQISPGRY